MVLCLLAEDFLLGHEIPSASGFHLCVLAQNPICGRKFSDGEAESCRYLQEKAVRHQELFMAAAGILTCPLEKELPLSPILYTFLPWTKSYITVFIFITQLHPCVGVSCPNKVYSA